jgi:hypothetical protein
VAAPADGAAAAEAVRMAARTKTCLKRIGKARGAEAAGG